MKEKAKLSPHLTQLEGTEGESWRNSPGEDRIKAQRWTNSEWKCVNSSKSVGGGYQRGRRHGKLLRGSNIEAQQKPCHRGVWVTSLPPTTPPPPPRTSNLLLPRQRSATKTAPLWQRTKRQTDVGIVMQNVPSLLLLLLLLHSQRWWKKKTQQPALAPPTPLKKSNWASALWSRPLTAKRASQPSGHQRWNQLRNNPRCRIWTLKAKSAKVVVWVDIFVHKMRPLPEPK